MINIEVLKNFGFFEAVIGTIGKRSEQCWSAEKLSFFRSSHAFTLLRFSKYTMCLCRSYRPYTSACANKPRSWSWYNFFLNKLSCHMAYTSPYENFHTFFQKTMLGIQNTLAGYLDVMYSIRASRRRVQNN